MGQKVHPTGIRLGIVKDHTSVWYADRKNYAKQLVTDLQVRRYIEEKLDNASVSRSRDRASGADRANITIHTARPGIVIGKKGEDVDKLRRGVAKMDGMSPVHINIERDSQAGSRCPARAQNVAQQLERRVMFRRAMKRVVTKRHARQGAEGIKVQVGGRLERCGDRTDRVVSRGSGAAAHAACGHRLRHFTRRATTYGILGVKVWIFKGEVFDRPEPAKAPEAEAAAARG
jgi:small subunit ribosomal protein S3